MGVSFSGPDVEGNGTLAIPYSFPNTLYGDPHRRLTLLADGIWLADAYAGQVSGTWTRGLGTACWGQGSHEIKAVAVACGQSGDAAYRAEAVTTVEVDHRPSVSLSVAPLDPADPGGLQVAAVAFSFPQTAYDVHRLLVLRSVPSGHTLDSIRPYERHGTWRTGVSCSNGANAWVEAVAEACGDTQATTLAALPLCPRPPRLSGCGRAGNQCCLAGGAGADGGGPGFGDKAGPPSEGPGARLRYLAGGAGSPGNPGQAAWNAILGRGWSHDYAERIVPAAGGRVWLITRDADFRELTDADNDGLYEKVSPEDEYRTLAKTATGWTLGDLDGTVLEFDSSGLWQSTTDRHGNSKTAVYTAGRLTEVVMPDGRKERFQYHASGKLAAIVEIGVETERETVVYTLSRTAAYVGAKARVASISGDCSSCGLAPNSQLFYDDPAHPLLPTGTLDGSGTETRLRYDAHGRVIEKTEAFGTPLSRTTTWTYDAAFPALPTRIEAPSTAGGAARRTTLMSYDAAGNLTSRRVQGVEAGSFFDLETVTTFHPSGQPLSVDPPGYVDDDETSFTWDPARGNLVPLTRTEPLTGTTTFEHDSFNRQTAVIDPNGVRTETTYDGLNRVLSVTQKGATAAEDLVTAHEYNAFGDLLRTTLPRGNVIEYGYDAAGRLISIEKKPDAATPGERTKASWRSLER